MPNLESAAESDQPSTWQVLPCAGNNYFMLLYANRDTL